MDNENNQNNNNCDDKIIDRFLNYTDDEEQIIKYEIKIKISNE